MGFRPPAGGGGVAARPASGWTAYAGNPIIPAAPGAVTLTGFGDVWFDSVNQRFECCVHVDGTTPGIYRYTSTDGLTGWVADPGNPILTVGAGGAWDATTVGVPRWWEEGGAWKMLYRGTGPGGTAVGLATAPAAGGPWTKSGSNPVITGTIGGISGGEINPPIKVGSTYYAMHSGQGYDRRANIVQSTNLVAWTAVSSVPILTGARFCGCIWKEGNFFYLCTPHYTAYNGSAELELWRCPNPKFLPSERHYMGVMRRITTAVNWERSQYDTPTVPADDITRSGYACTGGNPRIYYSGQGGSLFLMGVLLPDTTIPPVGPMDQKNVQMVGPWTLDDPTASLTDVQIPLLGSATKQFLAFPFSASVVGLQAWTEKNVTAGSVTVNATNWLGNKTFYPKALSAVIGVGAQRAGAQVEEGEWYFAHGEGVGIKVTTAAGLLPADLKLQASLAVIMR